MLNIMLKSATQVKLNGGTAARLKTITYPAAFTVDAMNNILKHAA